MITNKARLIYKTHTTYLSTPFPVHYYGMPNGKIYLVFSRFYKIGYETNGLEFVFAVHQEFSYDYEHEKLNPVYKEFYNSQVYDEMINKPDPKIKTIKIYRNLSSYGEAQKVLNQKAARMGKQSA